MCGIWSDSDDHLTTDPGTFLYSILYSKKAAVEAYTPLTHCPTALYLYSSYTSAIQQLYSSCIGCIAIQLYSSYTVHVYILYSIPLLGQNAWMHVAAASARARNVLTCATRSE